MSNWSRRPSGALLLGTTAFSIILAVALASACGGNSSLSPGGHAGQAGTSSGCAVGETRECVGPGACPGGQLCTQQGWAACECDSGGSGGAAGAPSSPAGGESDVSPAGDGAGGASIAAGPRPNDQECPDQSWLDCSGQCGKPTAECAAGRCGTFYGKDQLELSLTDADLTEPLVIRTPVVGDEPCTCAGTKPLVYPGLLRIHIAESSERTQPVFVVTPDPWRVDIGGIYDACYGAGPDLSSCTSIPPSLDALVTIVTEDASAPVVNVMLKKSCD